jgi:hypothetical protein
LITVLSNDVSPDEPLGRIMTHKNHYSSAGVSPAAFFPPPDLKLSTIRIEGMNLNEIWDLGKREVISRMKNKVNLYGLARLKVSDAQILKLVVEPDNTPFYRHTSITGWPQKALWLSITQQLAASSELILNI